MKRCRDEGRYLMIATVVGTHFIMTSMSLMWIFGNLAPYLQSYIYTRVRPDQAAYIEWTLALYISFYSLSLTFTDILFRRLTIRGTGLIAALIYNLALLTSSWTLDVSGLATAILLGAIGGGTNGVTGAVCFALTLRWIPKHSGVLIATATSVANVLAVFLNEALTWYVNPQNMKPDIHDGRNVFFSQPELLDCIPRAMFLFGLLTLFLQVVGYLLIANPPDPVFSSEFKPDDDLEEVYPVLNNGYSGHVPHELDNWCQSKLGAETLYSIQLPDTATNSDYGTLEDVIKKLPSTSPVNHDNTSDTSYVSDVSQQSFTCGEAIRCGSFWTMWLTIGALEIGNFLVNTYYKQFGLLYIRNDHFLTLIGNINIFLSPVFRVLVGWFYDKAWLDGQDLCVISMAAQALLCGFWFFSAQIHEDVYLVVILSLAAVQSHVYGTPAVIVAGLYGLEHFSLILSAICSAVVIVSPLMVWGYPWILQTCGWFWLFSTHALISLIILFEAVVIKFRQS